MWTNLQIGLKWFGASVLWVGVGQYTRVIRYTDRITVRLSGREAFRATPRLGDRPRPTRPISSDTPRRSR